MENIKYRTAKIEDLPTLLQFEQGIIEAERPMDPTLAQGSISYYNLEEMLSSNSCKIIVAICENGIVASGYAKIKEAKEYLNHTKYAYLGFMFTKLRYRGMGINKKIIEEFAR